MSTLIDRFVPQVTKEKLKEVADTELPKLEYSYMDALREGADVVKQLTGGFAEIGRDGEIKACGHTTAVLAATARGYMA